MLNRVPLKCETPKLTPELAQIFSEVLNKVPGERPLKDLRLKQIAGWIQGGSFISPRWSQGICKEDGKMYRLDGQHTSYVLTHLPPNVPFPNDLVVVILTYEFDSLQSDAPEIFDYFDNPVSARTNTDKMSIFRAQHPDLQKVSVEFLFKVSKGINLFESRLENGYSYKPRERGLLFDNPLYREFALWLTPLESTQNKRFLNKAGVTAPMLENFIENRKTAWQFWSAVFEESAEPGHPTRTLAKELQELSIRKKLTNVVYEQRAKRAYSRYVKMSSEERQESSEKSEEAAIPEA